jgi:hypothetical protein
MHDGQANVPGDREPARQLGECEKEQTVKIGGIAHLQSEDRRDHPLSDGFTIKRYPSGDGRLAE